MLTLPIKKKWFDMIKSGVKKEEYREIKPYYDSRFKIYLPFESDFNNIIFRNGYRKDSPKIKCHCLIYRGYGKKEWGAEPNKLYYVLKILSVGDLEKSDK